MTMTMNGLWKWAPGVAPPWRAQDAAELALAMSVATYERNVLGLPASAAHRYVYEAALMHLRDHDVIPQPAPEESQGSD